MKYARIEDGEVKEIGEFPSVEGRFHPSLAWVECPVTVTEKMRYEAGKFLPPPFPTAKEIIAGIKTQLFDLDLKRIRPLAEGDTVYLAKLNEQIVALRANLL